MKYNRCLEESYSDDGGGFWFELIDYGHLSKKKKKIQFSKRWWDDLKSPVLKRVNDKRVKFHWQIITPCISKYTAKCN